jgi:hypothetical protein
MGTVSFPGVKRPGRGVDHPPPSSAEVVERVELYLYFPSAPSWPVIGWTLPLPFTFAFRRQQRLRKRTSMLRFTYIACLAISIYSSHQTHFLRIPFAWHNVLERLFPIQIIPPLDKLNYFILGICRHKEVRIAQERRAIIPLFAPQIGNRLLWVWTWASAVRSRQVTARVTAQIPLVQPLARCELDFSVSTEVLLLWNA